MVDLPMLCAGPGSETTYDSQSTAVFPFQADDGRQLLVYMGDRWNAGGPGSVARASYVWLPLIPVAGPSSYASDAFLSDPASGPSLHALE